MRLLWALFRWLVLLPLFLLIAVPAGVVTGALVTLAAERPPRPRRRPRAVVAPTRAELERTSLALEAFGRGAVVGGVH